MGLRCDTAQTLMFVLQHVAPNSRILEIGAGDGALAVALLNSDHAVVTVDSSDAAVAAMKRRGVNAQLATWPDFQADLFDAILFTRSLHHVQSLEESVTHAFELLTDQGLLIVEDFAFHSVDARTVSWFKQQLLRLRERGSLSAHHFIDAIVDSPVSVRSWQNKSREIHKWDDIRQAISGRGEILHESDAPYLYRYVVEAGSDNTGRSVLCTEMDAAARGTIRLIGRRLVARKRA